MSMVKPSSPRRDRMKSVVIIGSGVFGITAAIELHARGWKVTVLDQGPVPHPDAASTDISKVVRMDYGSDIVYTEMGEQALDGWCLWNASWERPLYHADGFLVMARAEEMKRGGFEFESYHFLQSRGHRLERIRRADLERRHPAWNAACFGDGYFNPDAGWAESGRVIATLKQVATGRGIELVEGGRFASVIEKKSKTAGVRTADGREWRADTVLAAVGAWTPFVFPELRSAMFTTGQPVLHLRPSNPAGFRAPGFPVWAADIAHAGWYGFPANADGIVKIANHLPARRIDDPAAPREVAGEEIAVFRAFLRETFPSLANASLAGTRQCWYCNTTDGDFWIDHHPGRSGLIIAAGDSGHAFKFAPILGGLVADVVERRPNPWAHRFRWRTPRPAGGALR